MGDILPKNGFHRSTDSEHSNGLYPTYGMSNGIINPQHQQQLQQHQQYASGLRAGRFAVGSESLRTAAVNSTATAYQLDPACSPFIRNCGPESMPGPSKPINSGGFGQTPSLTPYQAPAPRPQPFSNGGTGQGSLAQERLSADRSGSAAYGFDGSQAMAAESAAAAAEPGGELEHFRRAFVELSRQNFMLRSRLTAVEQQLAQYEGEAAQSSSSSGTADQDDPRWRAALPEPRAAKGEAAAAPAGKAQSGTPPSAGKDNARGNKAARQNRCGPGPRIPAPLTLQPSAPRRLVFVVSMPTARRGRPSPAPPWSSLTVRRGGGGRRAGFGRGRSTSGSSRA